MQIIVDSLLTHYEQSGSGKNVIIMVHGWGDSLATFDDLSLKLTSNYTVVRLDLPGFGASQSPHEVWGLDNYVTHIASFVDKLKFGRVYAYLGHSNGGSVLIRGLGRGKLQSDKLVLLASAGIRDQETVRRAMLKIAAKTGKAATFWLPNQHKQALRKKLYGTIGSDLLVAPNMQETFKRTVREDVQADAKRIMIPALLIYGTNDPATPPQFGDIYSSLIKDSTLIKVPEAGHFVHHDNTDEVYKCIKDYLR